MASSLARPSEGRTIRLAAALALVALTAIVAFVIRRAGTAGSDGTRVPLDPTTTDGNELRRVTEMISRIIAAPPDQHEVSVQALETARVESAGVRDLKEACVNTYRGMIRAEDLQRQLGELVLKADAGAQGSSTHAGATEGALIRSGAMRAEELLRQARDQVELVEQSKDRCLDLYTVSIHRLGLAPARRWQSQPDQH